MHEDSAMTALHRAPLVPFDQKQLNLIGPKRVLESNAAQLQARGMEAPCPTEAIEKAKFLPWQLEFYGSSTLSSSAWAEQIAKDNQAATLNAGNRTCIPDVCHKGRVGKQGFCRMRYWFWGWVRHAAKNMCRDSTASA